MILYSLYLSHSDAVVSNFLHIFKVQFKYQLLKGVTYTLEWKISVFISRRVKKGLIISILLSLIWKITYNPEFYPHHLLYQEKSVSFVLDTNWLPRKHF